MLTVQSVPHETVLHVRVHSTPAVTELSVNHAIALQSIYMVIMAYHQTLVFVYLCFCYGILHYQIITTGSVHDDTFVCTCTSFNFSHEINMFYALMYTLGICNIIVQYG